MKYVLGKFALAIATYKVLLITDVLLTSMRPVFHL